MAKQYILGIDGGGTKTEAAVMNDEGQVLGTGIGGGTNINFVARRTAIASFKKAIREALEQAALEPSDITCAGSTFAMVVAEAFREMGFTIQPMALGEPQVVFERAGIHEMRGIALVAGTGSSCFGYDGKGNSFHSGGWGAILGDEGSAYDIGLRAIKRAMWALDGRLPHTLLEDQMKSYLDANRIRSVVSACGIKVNQRLVAGFATRVSEAAAAGDQAAIDILEEAGENLGELAAFVARNLFSEDDRFPVVLGGGVFKAGSLVIDPILGIFAAQFPRAEVMVASGKPGEAVARIAHRECMRRTGCC